MIFLDFSDKDAVLKYAFKRLKDYTYVKCNNDKCMSKSILRGVLILYDMHYDEWNSKADDIFAFLRGVIKNSIYFSVGYKKNNLIHYFNDLMEEALPTTSNVYQNNIEKQIDSKTLVNDIQEYVQTKLSAKDQELFKQWFLLRMSAKQISALRNKKCSHSQVKTEVNRLKLKIEKTIW